jgi:FkbM family methyltransferase
MATIFFKWIYPESEIYAFEPDKKTFELLKSNIEDNGLKNVHFFNVALSDKEGEIDFFIDSEERGSLLMSAKYERMPKDRITVDAISLSSFIKTKGLKQIDYIKMDIEGSEGEVMADLDKSGLLHLVDILTIEYHHKIGSGKSSLSQFLGILESNNYEYQVNAYCSPVSAKNKFQDVLFYIYRFSFN